jgi:IS5 family transposase
MARRTFVELVDDMDGGTADETVSFALDGVAYEIDLTAENAAELREAFGVWAGKARRVGGRRIAGKSRSGEDTAKIRAWAQEHGYSIGDRGRIPSDVRQAYKDAH